MPQVTIDDKGCRGCTMCVDICPVDVFEVNEAEFIAKVVTPDDCIGCLSCVYICPSRCVDVADVEMLRPFHRVEENAAILSKFLQEKSLTSELTEPDWDEAYRDVVVRLNALGNAVTETMGRGQRVVGRKAGQTAADHMPEMYEDTCLEEVAGRMQQRFKHAFDFDFKVQRGDAGEEVSLDFHPCGLYKIVTDQGQEVGKAVLCQLFHEYWAGLVSTFSGHRYKCEMTEVGHSCSMRLHR